MQVLVVDDDPEARQAVRRALEWESFEVIDATTGEQALSIADEHEFAMVVLDLDLPGVSGLDVLVALRQRRPHLHVLILTGTASEADRVTGLLSGADDYMGKPFSSRELAARAVAVRRRFALAATAAAEAEALHDTPGAVDARSGEAADASADPMVVLVGNEVVHANQAAADLVRAADPAELLGRDLYEFVAPQSLSMAASRQESARGGHWPRPDVMAIVRLDGEEVLIEVSSMPVTWHGRIASQITMWDVRGETSKVREVAMGFRTEVADAVIVTDETLRIQSINAAAEQLYGWSEAELIGRNGSEALPAEVVHVAPDDSGDLWEVLERRGSWRGELRQTRRDGTFVEVRSSVTLLRDGQGLPVGTVVVNRPMQRRGVAVGRRTTDGSDDELDDEIRLGIERREFEVHYQPVVRLDDRSWHGVEALVRWRHPQQGLLPPASFIEAAERSGAIVALGGMVLVEACRQWAAWHEQGFDLEMAVNLSGRQLADEHLPVLLRETMQSVDMPPGALALEVTETSLVEDIELASAVLREATGAGATISIDDFGTGWASLTYLRRFPVHTLKIDRAFVAGLGTGTADEAIVTSIVSLGSELGLSVVAEGLETPHQVEIVSRLGCALGQGYLFSRPLPAADLHPVTRPFVRR